ncbi:MAG: glutathione-disulfide reductase [Ectothiorhodospiraceae bacterium]|nr:glutathione-disulfide reductase [Ectothiorhodospiraceae bacterium]
MTQHFDLIAIGGGSGGLATARRATRYGASAAVIESSGLCGTCVNVGCVPKKIMWQASGAMEAIHRAGDYGIGVSGAELDWATLKARRDAYIQRLNGIYQRNLDKDAVTLFRGHGRFVGAGTLEVGDQRLTADHVIIATGGKPRWPAIPGAELGIDSDGFFALEEQPRRVAVVGAGYIAVELAGVLAGLGSDSTLVIRHQTPLRGFDAMLQQGLMEALPHGGVKVQPGFVPARLSGEPGALVLEAEDGQRLENLDVVIWAIGRDANTQGLGLDAAGVVTDNWGNIPVDRWQQTNVEGVYALGDITGQMPLTPVAIAAGRRLSDRLFGGMQDRYLDYANIPTVVFSHPPIGTVGLSEEDARAQYGNAVQVFTSTFVGMDYALSDEKVRTHMKLVTVGDEQRIVGAHVIGNGADEMLQGFAVAVRMGATKQDFDETVAIHPTSAEEMVTMV